MLSTTRQFDRPMSNGMAALSREDTTPQSLTDTHCSINAANIEERKTWDAK